MSLNACLPTVFDPILLAHWQAETLTKVFSWNQFMIAVFQKDFERVLHNLSDHYGKRPNFVLFKTVD